MVCDGLARVDVWWQAGKGGRGLQARKVCGDCKYSGKGGLYRSGVFYREWRWAAGRPCEPLENNAVEWLKETFKKRKKWGSTRTGRAFNPGQGLFRSRLGIAQFLQNVLLNPIFLLNASHILKIFSHIISNFSIIMIPFNLS